MSVNPVASVQPSAGADLADASLHRDRSVPAPRHSSEPSQPDPGIASNRDQLLTSASTVSAEGPQDEVEVQRDSGADGEIVIRYLNQSGNVILQVPSSEVLGMARAAEQDLERKQLKVHEDEHGPQPAGNGGNSNGD